MSSTLGKRKDREDEPQTGPSAHGAPHGSTLFVSNLPYTATSVDLQTLFSDIAPVRSAFIVTEHGTGVSKGVGYVSFAIKEDAEAAYEKISKEGLSIVGRKLRVQWAESKAKNKKASNDVTEGDEEGEAKTTTRHKERPAHPKPPKPPSDPDAIRTIVVSGLPPSVDSKALWKKMRKYGGAEKVDWPVKGDNGEDDPTIAHVLFSTPSNASEAVTKLHAHVFKSHLLSVTLKKRLDSLAKSNPRTHKKPITATDSSTKSSAAPVTSSTKDEKRAAGAPSHASRLIVRNLPFDITEQDLKAVFLPFGPIYSIHIPTVPVPTSTNTGDDGEGTKGTEKIRAKGFAFIWYLSKKDAEKAIGGCNGITVKAGTAERVVKDKQKKKKLRRIEEKIRKARKKEGDEEGEEDADAEGEDAGAEDEDDKAAEKQADKGLGKERVIAVDWVLSKDKWEEEKAKMEAEAQEEDVDMNDASASKEESSDDGEGDEGEDGLGVHHGSSSDEEGSSQEDSDEDNDSNAEDDDRDNEDDKPVKPQLPQTDVGTTVFIRNVPFEATEEDLRVLFRAFGPLRYARITMDHSTGRSRGTGFACFWNKEDADKVISQSELLRSVAGVGEKDQEKDKKEVKKKNPFAMPSLLTPDPSTSLAQNLVLHGRTLDVVRAVTRDEAGRLKEEGERAREKADKRNMYLLKEGVIFPNSHEAANLTPADLERRTNSYNARKNLLKSNPSLYISKTRLSIRQIPLFMTERMLKKLSGFACREFEKEVKEGKREGLKEEEKRVSREDERKVREELGLAGDKKGKEHDDQEENQDDESEEEHPEEEGDKKPSKKSKKKKALLLSKLRKSGSVKQAKIVRQQDRIDSLSGKGRSKGYGFVEMYRHEDALRVLRWCNSNKRVGELVEKWWIEEVEVMIKSEKGKLKEKEKVLERVKELVKKGYGKSAQDVEEAEKEVKLGEERVKRLTKELEECRQAEDGSGRKVKGNLIVEFSIENVQVVQRRNTLHKERRHGARGNDNAKTPSSKSTHLAAPTASPAKRKANSQDARPTKKRRLSMGSIDSEGQSPKKPVRPHSRQTQTAGRPPKAKARDDPKSNKTKDSTLMTKGSAPTESHKPTPESTKRPNKNPTGNIIGRKRMERRAKKVGKK
ncbi:hypothetical protein AX16_004811 [Volvariella volvacea WC 439]|nr:hypothetical protein AX16_004811 [Volvariella volvacea WC 439]